MQSFLALLLIALGGAGLVALREARLVLGALLVQWLALAWVAGRLNNGNNGPGLAAVLVELLTALASVAVLFLTVTSVRGLRMDRMEGLTEAQRQLARQADEADRPSKRGSNLSEAWWPLAIILMSGAAGLGLATVFTLGADEQTMLAFYWTLLSGAMALVLDGSRSPIKLAAGLLALLNGLALLVFALGVSSPGPATLGLLSLGRIATVAVISYAYVVLKVYFLDTNLDTLFNVRSGSQGSSTALTVIANEQDAAGEPPTTETISQPRIVNINE